MKHLKLFFAYMLMAVLSIGQVWGTEAVYKQTIFSADNNEKGVQNYTSTWTNTTDGFIVTTVNANNNNNGWSGTIKIGTKTNASTGTITTNAAIDKAITKVTLTIDAIAYPDNVTSITLKTSSNGSSWTSDGTFTKEVGAKTVTLASPTADLYYQIEVICTGASKNGCIQFSQIDFYAEEGGGGGSSNPTVSSDPTSWDFGAVATDAAASKVFSVSGSDLEAGTLTLTAPSGYSVSPASISVASAGGLDATNVTVSKNTTTAGTYNGNLTISGCGLEEDVAVALAMEVKAKYTVTWNNNGSTSTSQVLDGAKPVFPATPESCDATSTTFVGWATAPWVGKLANLDDKTVYTKAADMPAVTGAVTYYAVFAKVGGASGWNLTDITDLTSSDVFVLADASNYALNNDGGTSNAPSANAITVSDGKITSEVADKLKWNISGNATDGYTFYPNGTTESWLYCSTTAATGSNNNMRVGTGDRKVFVVNASGYLVTNDASTDRYLSRYNTQDFRGYVNTDTNPVTPKCYKYSAGSASDYMTTCCTQYNVNIAAGIENGSVSADPTAACEGATVTLTFTPAGGYHLESWSVNGTAQAVNATTFSMPAAAATVSATFAHDDCANLAAPTLDEITKTYNSATIAWNEVTDAEEYAVSVVNHATSESVFAGNVDALSKALADLEPETQYDYSIMAVGDGTIKCADGNGVLAGNFTTEALPTAHLTLIDPSGAHASSGDYAILTPFNLPSTAAACSKTFMGWDPDENCATAPAYAKGAEFTFANTTGVTLHAVYADVTGGGTSTTDIAYSGSTTNMTGGNDAATFGLDADDWSVVGAKGNNSNYPGLNTAGDIRLYYSEGGGTTITVTAPQTITSVGLTFTGAGYSNAYVKVGGETVALSDGVYPINATSFEIGNANTSSVQVRISNIAVNFTTPGTPSNYSTTCAAAPEVIVDPEEINATAAAVAAGVITAAYDNVDEENIAVALYNDQACSEAFDGGWLTASINGDNNIAYSIAENTSYASDRKAYIKLTAPASSTGVAAATVVIPVTQAKKAAVFASLEELVASDAPANSNVTVSFSNVVIKEIYMYNSNRRGLTFNIQKAGHDIKIYFNADVPAAWVAGGKVSGTLTNCPWKIYSEAWQLAPTSGWAWDNGDLTYTAPPAISSIEIRGTATAKTYIDGQAFNPAGLSVVAIYDNSDEEDVTSYATWTFDPAKLSESDTEVEVTAEYNDKTDTETVEGLTVNPIPNKTIAEFVAAGGTRCYLEGVVSNYTNTTKGYFDMTDASGTIHIYGCTSPSSFAAGDKIKVIAETYEYYQSTTHEAKNVEFVSKISPVQITIADQTLEEGNNWTIVATTDPEGAVANITYDIKDDGSDAFVSLAGNVITANAVGTATIIASIPEGTGYLANSIEFEVEVVEAGSVANVVILVEYEGAWYAMKHDKSGVLVDYQPAIGKIYGMTDPDEQAEIIWSRSKAGTTYTFTTDNKYIKGANSGTALSVEAGETGKYQWEKGAEDTYYHCLTGRTFFYNGTEFKNFAIGNAGNSGYSSLPKVELSDDIFTTHTIYTRPVTEGRFGTICLPNGGVMVGAALFEVAYHDATLEKIFFDEILNGEMVAGRPYIFLPNDGVSELGVYYTDAANEDAGNYRGLYGSYTQQVLAQEAGNYILYNNQYMYVGASSTNVSVGANRAYFKIGVEGGIPTNAVAPLPGRRRVSMSAVRETPTGLENGELINGENGVQKVLINGELFILRGEKMYDATGRLVK